MWTAILNVIHGSLERSVQLAAAMDSRGYGRTAQVSALVRRGTAAVLLLGVGGLLLGLYGTLSGGEAASLGPPLIVGGGLLAIVGLALAGKRQVRTHYRPDPWVLPEWLVVVCGAVPAAVFIAAGSASFSSVGAGLVGTPALTVPIMLACGAGALPASDRSSGARRGAAMNTDVVTFRNVSITYSDAVRPALANLDFAVAEGEFLLVVGPTGSGKSTLLGAINGLVPHFTGGTLNGEVTVAGRSTATHPPRELADLVGMVPQNTLAGFVTDSVEDELAYTMESLGLAPSVMRRRVEEVVDLLGLAEIRSRPLLSLSGGQRQRVAIGSVLTASPKVLVLDEPTSALDPGAAEDVLSSLQRLVHDLGLTVIIAEHRLERVVQYADRIAMLPIDGAGFRIGSPADMMLDSPVAPPVVELARAAGWSPVPLSVREARRFAPELRARLAGRSPQARPAAPAPKDPVATLRMAAVQYGRVPALKGVTADLMGGQVVALMGRNGAGKSTMLLGPGGHDPPHPRPGPRPGPRPERPGGPGPDQPGGDGAAGARRPADRRARRPGVLPGRPRRRRAARHRPRTGAPAGARDRRRRASAGSERGPAPHPGHLGGTRRVALAAAPGRADPGPGLPDQGRPGAAAARGPLDGCGGGAGHPRRGAGGGGVRSRHGAGRRGGRRRGAVGGGGRGLARCSPPRWPRSWASGEWLTVGQVAQAVGA